MLPNNVGDLGKIIVAASFEWMPKVQKSPNLVTLLASQVSSFRWNENSLRRSPAKKTHSDTRHYIGRSVPEQTMRRKLL